MRIERQVFFWLAALVVAVLFIGALREILLPFIVGMIVAYALNPIVDRLVSWGLSRTIASAIIMAVMLALLTVLLVKVAPILYHQAENLALALPDQLKQLRAVIESIAREKLGARFPEFSAALDRTVVSLTENWTNLASLAAKSLFDQIRSLFNLISLLLVTPLVAFYLLVDWYPMLNKIDGWLPRDHAPTIRRLGIDVNTAVSAFIRGQGLVCLILAGFYAIGLSLTGLEYGLLIGLATGILAFVPFVGWALGLIVALALAAVQFWPQTGPIGIVALVFMGGQVIDAAFLSPTIVGSRIGLHPVWLLFALLVFSYLFGFVGVLVAVPVAAAIGVLVRFGLNAYLQSEVYKGKGSAI
ncbi:MAG: AI-2E family transporter [Hyphomicrobiaceae bacterium]